MFAPSLLLAAQWDQAYKRQLLVASVTIAVVLLFAALVLAWVRRLNKRKAPFKLSAGDQLAEFRVLYERGELSAEEFQRLRALLTERMHEELSALQQPAESEAAGPVVQVEKPKDNGPTGNNGAPGAPTS